MINLKTLDLLKTEESKDKSSGENRFHFDFVKLKENDIFIFINDTLIITIILIIVVRMILNVEIIILIIQII